jgi:hypothetical protein
MKSRKGFTLIELIVFFAILIVFSAIVTGIVLVGIGIYHFTKSDDAILESNPPIYTNGQIVSNTLTGKQLIVVDSHFSWNKSSGCWNVKVQDGGVLDKIGGYICLETVLKPEDINSPIGK